MRYCSQCGQPIEDHEEHVCPAQSNPNTPPTRESSSQASTVIRNMKDQASRSFDAKRMTNMMLHPIEARNIDAKQDWIYAVIALLLGAIGMSLWAYLVASSIFAFIMGPADLFSSVLNGGIEVPFSFFFKIFLMTLLIYAALFAALWITARLRGENKLSFVDLVVRLGTIQLPYGPGFILAGILSFISFQLSLIVIAIFAITSLIMSFLEVLDMANVARARRFQFTLIGISIYSVLFIILTKLFF